MGARFQQRGFSLLELLMVMVLLVVLFAFGLSGYNGAVQASALTTSADMVSDAFNEARQGAMAQNTTVEVRIYAVPVPGHSSPVYSVLQLHWLKADKTTPPAGRPWILPSSVVIDTMAEHSSLIAANKQIATPDPTDARLDAQTRVFHFLPDGSTDLDPTAKWFLTLRAASQSDPAHFPSNWVCVQVDPTTGRGQVYRP